MTIEKLLLTLVLVATLIPNAYSYIDPGSGSVVTTAILGMIAAVGYTFRKYYYKITDFFRGGRNQPDKTSVPNEVIPPEQSDVEK